MKNSSSFLQLPCVLHTKKHVKLIVVFLFSYLSFFLPSYGDRCPQSVGGRLFAVIWILIGICVCSVFTAALTTSLTTLSMETNINLPGAKVCFFLLQEFSLHQLRSTILLRSGVNYCLRKRTCRWSQCVHIFIQSILAEEKKRARKGKQSVLIWYIYHSL